MPSNLATASLAAPLDFLDRFIHDLTPEMITGTSLLLVLCILLLIATRMGSTISRQKHRIRQLSAQLHGAQVRRGYASEALAPLLERFPVPVGKPGTTTLFVGQPVDYLHFDEQEGVTFIEIKSGGAGLSQRQRRLRQLVEQGQVRWATMNVDSA